MTGALQPLRHLWRRFARSQSGTATVEFVIMVPLVLAFLLSSVDYGVVMIRQVFLDRAVDMAVRQVRLGNVAATSYAGFRAQICENTFLLSHCEDNIAIELRPVDTATWSGLNEPAQCVNREANISPVLAFRPSTGSQVLMLIRVCVVADPFISLTGLVLGMPEDASGGFYLVSNAAFANEPA